MAHDTENNEFSAVLRRAVRFTGRRQLLIAALALLPGLFLLSAQHLGLDPSAFQDPTTTALCYGLGACFVAVAAYLLYIAFYGNAKGARRLVETLERNPDHIVEVGHVIHSGTSRLTVVYRGRSSISLAVPAADVGAFVGHITLRAPHAVV